MLRLQIEALDTYFFRDGRPFTMGVDTAATGPFPPSPQVVYGAIRASMATAEGLRQEHIDDLTKSIKIVDFGLYTLGERYYPAPLDILLPKEAPVDKPYGFVPNTFFQAKNGCVSNGGKTPDYWLYTDEFVEQVNGYYISESELKNYLETSAWDFPLLSPPQAYRIESKTGIGRLGFTKTVDPGNLYRIGMVRPVTVKNEQAAPLHLLVGIENDKGFDHTSMILLGGEGKLASVTEHSMSSELPLPKSNDQYFKLYLKSPSIFDRGHAPDLSLSLGFELEPFAWMTGKPIRIGGFDMKQRCPKKMLSTVPAGSVYYYKLPAGVTFGEVAEKFSTIRSISDHRTNEGFGLYAFGTLPWENYRDSSEKCVFTKNTLSKSTT